MSEGTASPLFRGEALKWRQEAWIGSVQLIEPLSGKIAALCTVALVVCVGVYVVFGSYTRRIHANGVMLPPEGLVVAEADQGGVIAAIHTHEGDHVKAGERLFSVDVSNWSETGATGRQLVDGLRREQHLLESRQKLLAADAPVELSSLKDELASLRQQYGVLQEQSGRDKQSLPLIERAMNEMRTAMGRHLVTETQFQSQLFSYVQFMDTQSQTLRTLVEMSGHMADLQYRINRHQYKVAEDMNDLAVRLSDVQRQIIQAHGQSMGVINARVSGTVDGIRTVVGQRVNPGQSLLSILPDNATLQAELYVNSQAVGFVRPGQRVLLKYAAYPYQRFGLYEGEVVEVTKAPLPERSSYAANASKQNGSGASAPQPGGDVYRIRVRPSRDFIIAYGKHEKLTPGMAVEAEIAIDQRKLYQWLLDPVVSMVDTVRSISGGGAPAHSLAEGVEDAAPSSVHKDSSDMKGTP
ncbi:HlyD family secretion protein [Bombella sp. TMW 2.2543]|uniref:HlyD family secretion protein n=1 Tax=Bombella pluederhausensis TaxID=2967336 RepID=A0ABT3WL75_9PROT|nr:HlyD family efflux transporter periplasmic adaptor subunit [Bombella pluederhausensis]MCX5618388.1 HlyD family secretion protein [Bombella pluederhausensis]